MKKYCSLTFDDGPNNTVTPLVLDLLKEHDITASFFLIGRNITADTEKTVRRCISQGCDIQNHSLTHRDMTKLTPEEIRMEFERTEERIFNITGVHTQFFRPPYICINDTMYENIDRCFICGQGCDDWEMSVTAKERYDKAAAQACDGSLVLLHDMEGNIATVEMLKRFIPDMKAQGFEFVTCSEMFKRKGVDPAGREARGKLHSVVG